MFPSQLGFPVVLASAGLSLLLCSVVPAVAAAQTAAVAAPAAAPAAPATPSQLDRLPVAPPLAIGTATAAVTAVESAPATVVPATPGTVPSLPPPPSVTEPGLLVPPAGPVPAVAPAPGVVVVPPGSAPIALTSRQPMRHVPRAYSLAVGYGYMPINHLPVSTTPGDYTQHGIVVDARFGWQVGGLERGWPAWVGFMGGFSYFFAGSAPAGVTVHDTLNFDYGIFVKHSLFPGRRVRLFFGYGLGAVQTWVRQNVGRGIGHVTRLSAGIDTRISAHTHFTLELAYKIQMLPTFATETAPPEDHSFQTLNLLAGFWFGR